MTSTEISAKVLDLVYDAAANPSLWVPALLQIGDLLQCPGAVMHGHAVRLGGFDNIAFEHNGGLDEACNRAYRERHLNNAWSAHMVRQPAGRIVLSEEIMVPPVLQRTAFYADVLKPQNLAHAALIPLASRQDFLVGLTVGRGARRGPFDEDERKLLTRLVPHLNRALLLGMRLRGYEELHRGAFAVLDQLSVGVLLLDRNARLLYANTAARAHCGPDGALALKTASITTHSDSHSRRLYRMIHEALAGVPTAAMNLPTDADAGALTLVVVAVRPGEADRFSGPGLRKAAVLIFIVDPEAQTGAPAAWLQQAYGLTPAESRVALAIASGLTLAQAARGLAIKPNTVKTHLQRVFAKLRVSRQTELVRLIAALGLVSPGERG